MAKLGRVAVITTIVIVVVGIYVVVHLSFLTWRIKRPGIRVRQAGRDSERIEARKQAAADNVDAVRRDARYISPDAPGNHQDDL